MLVGEILDKNARRTPNKEALVYEKKRYTYQQLREQSNRLANALLSLGLKPGDRAAYQLFNSDYVAVLFFALAKSGAWQVPINANYKAGEIGYLLSNSQARLVITEEELLPGVLQAVSALDFPCRVLSIGESKSRDAPNLSALASEARAADPPVALSESDPFLILYTSGTTGKPKGAMLSHRGSVANVTNRCLDHQLTEEDASLIVTPLFHSAGLFSAFLTHVFIGGKAVIVRKYDPEEVFLIINREAITFIFLVPTMLRTFLDARISNPLPIPSLKKILYGADRTPAILIQECLRHFPGISFYNGYGLTEGGPSVSTLPPEYQLSKMGSAGRAVPLVQIRVANDRGEDVAQGEVGEIIVKSDSVMVGYYDMPEATAQAIRDGWLYTGDLGYFDEDGFLFIADRKKDLIISGGVNIYPREIEEVLFHHPGVAEAAVVGVPDEVWGQSVKAFVVKKDHYDLMEEDITAYCKERLASYKKPKVVQFVLSLPKTASGKVMKEELKRLGR